MFKFDVESFNLKNLNYMEVKEEYQEVSRLENLEDDYVYLNRVWEIVREEVKPSATESRLM
jgi:hypothetical protein